MRVKSDTWSSNSTPQRDAKPGLNHKPGCCKVLFYRWIASEFSSPDSCTFLHSVSTGGRECWLWATEGVLDRLFWGLHRYVPARKAGDVATSRAFQLQGTLSKFSFLVFNDFFLFLFFLFISVSPLHFPSVPILRLASWIFSNSFDDSHLLVWFGVVTSASFRMLSSPPLSPSQQEVYCMQL